MYTKNELAYFMRAKDLFVVLIAETWADEERLKNIKWITQFENMLIAPRANRCGGLVLFWRSTIDVTIEGYNLNYIDVTIEVMHGVSQVMHNGILS